MKKISEPVTRPQYERMCQLIRRIQKGDHPNRPVLAAELEVKARTIQRDIIFLRDRWKMPIEFDPRKRGYHFTQAVTNFPLLHISEGELISVFVAQKALTQYHGTPFEQPLRAAFDKLVTSLKGEISVAWPDLETAISFRSMDSLPAGADIFRLVSLAVQSCREIEFQYLKLEASDFEKRRLRPYHLACINNQWYLFGFDLLRQEIRTFVLSRMKGVSTLPNTFVKPRFSVDQFLKGSFGVFSGGEAQEIMIWFDSFAAKLVMERNWHHSQKIVRLSKGEIKLTLTLTSTIELVPWILSWGTRARVLSPSSAVDVVAEHVRGLSKIYETTAGPSIRDRSFLPKNKVDGGASSVL